MGKTSTQAKQRWNAANYKQVKVSVKPEIAIAFKEACEASNVSMTSELSAFMCQYAGIHQSSKGYSPDLSTRRKRRTAICAIIQLLERIKDNEERYKDNIPENLNGSQVFDNAEQSIDLICEAIDVLRAAY